MPQVAGGHDIEQYVRGTGAEAEMAELVHDEHGGPDIGLEDVDEAALAAGAEEVADEGGGAGEECVEGVLNCLVDDGGGEVGLTASRRDRPTIPTSPSSPANSQRPLLRIRSHG